ncbi:hypothetical protein GCM10022393_29170 [Aquimarina addita]|uniref:Uncharacterized protein n=1 Tax=Aquimarina addita TaxID=870485 RepID=A0ABP6UQL9_9FLAO
MKKIILFLAVISLFYKLSAQVNPKQLDSIALKADRFIGVDSFGAIYFTEGNIFYKKWNQQQWQFGDFILGELTDVYVLNPLKIVLFYQPSNTVVLVDKYLNEIDRINFNTITEFKNVTQVSPANENRIWVFDSNTQQLEIFDTTSEKTIVKTQPISTLPHSQHSNFNYCWLLTSDKLLLFNIYGSLLTQIENENFLNLKIINNDLILQKEDGLYFLSNKAQKKEKINLPEIPIKQFYVTNEILYIYDQRKIYSFALTPQKN